MMRRDHERFVFSQSARRHRHMGWAPSGQVIDVYRAPPSFLLWVWASFPLLFIASLDPSVIAVAIIAAILNYVIITHMDTYCFILYCMCGLVLLALTLIYHWHWI